MENPAAWVNALIVVSFPVLCLISVGASWLVWALRKSLARRPSSLALVVAALPLLPIAYFTAALVIETAGVIASGQPLGLHSTIIKH